MSALQLESVTKALEASAAEGIGLQTVYSLVDWLENDLLSFLNIDKAFKVAITEDRHGSREQTLNHGRIPFLYITTFKRRIACQAKFLKVKMLFDR